MSLKLYHGNTVFYVITCHAKQIGSEVATFSTIGNMHEEGGKKYPAFSIYEKNELMRKFNCLKLLAGGSVKEHISVMKRLLNDISLAGHDFKEDLKIHVILYSLPDSWDDFVGTLFAIKNTVEITAVQRSFRSHPVELIQSRLQDVVEHPSKGGADHKEQQQAPVVAGRSLSDLSNLKGI
ncbi:hypothetical protein EJ110_NYTH46706 [Nymphaea thermarum]|nr:hypothetical protein EJ110_NYTH46706 [Nymphaea thermarum]